MSSPPNQANIIPLRSGKAGDIHNEKAVKEQLLSLPKELQCLRDLVQKPLLSSIQNFFDKVDDALFERADIATSNTEQNVFFESMREVRIRRSAVEKSFMLGIDRIFAQLMFDNSQHNNKAEQKLNLMPDELAVVSNDELEEVVAIDSLVNKAMVHNKHALLLFSNGINQIIKKPHAESALPLSPRCLADSFVDASQIITIDIKAKLVLFKLFERFVVGELPSLLKLANQSMAEMGVSMPRTAGPAAGELYSTLQTLLEPQNPSKQPLGSSSSASGSVTLELRSETHSKQPAPPDENVDLSKLLFALSQLQQSQLREFPLGSSAEKPQLLPDSQIQSVFDIASNGSESIDEHFQNVIKLIEMLFSFIIEDRNLPDPIKSLLAKLQVPFIKVAILDDDFFKQDGHPARRLLNEMATSAIGWTGTSNSNKPDPLLTKIESVVTKVLSEYDGSLDIFTLLLTDFVAFQEKERRRIMLFEQRAIDAEDAKAKAELGRQQVGKELSNLMSGYSLPDVYTRFIEGPWSNMMFLIYMRQGSDSQQWANALMVVDKLIWSAQPIEDENHKVKLETLLPRLQKLIVKGLETISYAAHKQKQLFKQFNLHYQCLFDIYEYQEFEEEFALDLPSEDRETTNKLDLTDEEVINRIPSGSISKNLSDQALQPSGDKVQSKTVEGYENQELSLNALKKAGKDLYDDDSFDLSELGSKTDEQEIQSESVPSNTPGMSASDQYLRLTDSFTVGMWFESQEQAEAAYRCRLAAIIRGTGKYIFVNRAGIKVAEETKASLAIKLESGGLRTLDDSMLFDRALESVISNLRQGRSSK